MKRARWLTLLFSTFIALSLINLSFVEAKSVSDIDNKIKEIEQEEKKLNDKKSKVSKDKEEVQGKMSKNKNEQKSVEAQMEEIEKDLNKTETNIEETTNKIEKTEAKINELEQNIRKLNDEIADLKERIQMREELLRDRLRSIQETGGNVQYVSVLFGSQSFSDLISRSSAVNAIMDQDKNIMEEHAADQLALEEKQVEVKEKKKEVELQKEKQEEQKENLEGLKNKLDDQKAEKEKIKAQLEDEYKELEYASLSLKEEEELIEKQAAVLEEAKKLMESEKKSLLQQNQNNLTSGGSNNSGSKGQVSSSGFIWPTDSRNVTSSFDPNRFHPIHKKVKPHNGMDIGAPSGANVYAVSGGIVAHAGWMGGYGNTIMISHGSSTTLYAHLSSVNVSNGQRVKQGDVIGTVGSTGDSTGPHLHFEVHPGKYKNPVDPRPYLP